MSGVLQRARKSILAFAVFFPLLSALVLTAPCEAPDVVARQSIRDEDATELEHSAYDKEVGRSPQSKESVLCDFASRSGRVSIVAIDRDYGLDLCSQLVCLGPPYSVMPDAAGLRILSIHGSTGPLYSFNYRWTARPSYLAGWIDLAIRRSILVERNPVPAGALPGAKLFPLQITIELVHAQAHVDVYAVTLDAFNQWVEAKYLREQ